MYSLLNFENVVKHKEKEKAPIIQQAKDSH